MNNKQEKDTRMAVIKAIGHHLKLNAERIADSVKKGSALAPAAAIFAKAIAPHLPPSPKFHNPSEYPTRVEGEEFSVDVFILDETGVHGIAFWNFDDKVWRFHTDTLVDYNEPNAETKWKWYYPPYDLNQVFNR